MASFNQTSGTIVFPKNGSVDSSGDVVPVLTQGDEFNFNSPTTIPSVDTTYVYNGKGYWTGS